MDGIELIAAERQRQIAVEGWTPEHDDSHDLGEMVIAAWAYAQCAINIIRGHKADRIPDWWPWAVKWWKPSSDPIRNLVKAGALIAAEIDRLQRAAPNGNG